MENIDRTKGRVQDPKERVKNFEEVEKGFNDEEAAREASRCLNCMNPRCVTGCPVNIAIPEFISAVKENDLKKAYEVISRSSSLPAVCGRVCPQEKQCEKLCIRGLKGESVAIGSLERYVADQAIKNEFASVGDIKKNGKKVAIVGSGPAGLTCAGDLAKAGYDVTIYEVLHKAGGVLTYGIPEFRLPKEIVKKEVATLEKLGVKVLTDVPIGNALTINDLREEYDAIFLGTGAGLPKFMGIEGEDANGVFSANEILTRINLMGAYKEDCKTPVKVGKTAYVIGGGNVAMDAVRSLKRLGVDAHIMYRRSLEELPARKMEVEHAQEEGIVFDILKNPKRIVVDENNNVVGMEVVNMVLGEPGEDGRRGVTEETGSEHIVDCDMVVMALGTGPNHEALKESDIELSDRGLIVTKEETTRTSIDNVYAGGDAVTGAATVILAMEAGKKAAKDIMDYLNK
ncbi:MAG: NADPH-dependent glutamate synthase [Bacilli bacterium]|nr:NADPH-dependent glutamate synthase [Bacilli bacterium]